ncbi:MAG TPA: LTA synthase family protein [Candidatus Polarisedimenticolaceae bacterium]|nr:LTA synthase family protein [Candidatus Polarisedimenticolaceae bacterium]
MIERIPHRLRIAAYPAAALLVVGALLRVALYARFHDGAASPATLLLVLAAGASSDAPVAVLLASPLALGIALFRLKSLERAAARFALFAAIGAGLVFGAFVEWFFFSEFDSRFNNIAIDYLRSPREVAGNIGESFPVALFVALALAGGAALALAGVRATRGAVLGTRSAASRRRSAAAVLAGVAAAALAAAALPSDLGADRVESELAANGLARFVHAATTGNLDYAVYYRTLPPELARRRAAAVLDAPWIRARRDVPRPAAASAGAPRPWDVVVILEESLGSEFVGALGHAERKTTPGLDRWSREGILLTNLTATGNRTVRGLEGTLCSLVPLPGASVLKRMKHEEVATLADVFRGEGYRTAFFYGGWGRFDDMKPFFPDNGFEEFIERGSYPDDAFSTIWGVADEWILDALLTRQLRSAREGSRLFATALTVSNHRPFRVPERGTAWPAAKTCRESAVAYADWALARYLDRAKAAGLLEHTLVLIEGDHGARVYGAEDIPTASYRIPGLFLVPGARWRGVRLDRLCSQIDLAPTLLALTGRSPRTPFLGEDVTSLPADGGRAFVQHDRDVGLLTDRALVTLGLQRRDRCYTRPGRDSDTFSTAVSCTSSPQLQTLEDDAASVFQTADALLKAGSYAPGPSGGTVLARRQSSR